MVNLAAELLEIFNAWRGQSHPQNDREMNDPAKSVAEHILAMKLVSDIRVALDEVEATGQSMEVFREASMQWAYNVLTFPHGWSTTNGSEQLYNASRIDMLMALDVVLAGRAPRVDLTHFANFDAYLDGIVELLSEDAGVDPALRSYMVKLVNQMRRASDEYKATGKFDAEDALQQLWVSLMAAEARSQGHKAKWREYAAKLRTPVTAGLLVEIPMLSIEVLKIALGG
ncbi:MAG: hypothetical protein ABIW36_02550 [Terrimesophilobacter sp.]